MLCCAVLCRLLCFKCLNFLVTSSLVRNKGAASNPAVTAWLDKVVKPVLIGARKGGILVPDQQVRPAALLLHCVSGGRRAHSCPLLIGIPAPCLCIKHTLS